MCAIAIDLGFVTMLSVLDYNRSFFQRFPKRGILKGEFESLYKMSTSTPGVGIQPLQATGETRFIQSLSQGSRCLKKGDVILYKVISCRMNPCWATVRLSVRPLREVARSRLDPEFQNSVVIACLAQLHFKNANLTVDDCSKAFLAAIDDYA